MAKLCMWGDLSLVPYKVTTQSSTASMQKGLYNYGLLRAIDETTTANAYRVLWGHSEDRVDISSCLLVETNIRVQATPVKKSEALPLVERYSGFITDQHRHIEWFGSRILLFQSFSFTTVWLATYSINSVKGWNFKGDMRSARST